MLSHQIETPDYFKDKVYHNYIYKGRQIEKRAKKNLKNCDFFSTLIAQLPDQGNVAVLNCGQGEFTLLAALTKKELQITAIEANTELLDIAKNCVSIPDNLFYCETVVDYEIFDIFVVLLPND